MKRRLLICVLSLIFCWSGCSSSATTEKNAQASGGRTPQEAKAESNRELQKEIERIASAAKGRVGVAATVLETRESVSLNPRERFPMQSVYKFPIGMALLRQVDAGKISLQQRVRVEKKDFVSSAQHSPIRDKNPNGVELSVAELLRLAVSESDGTASDVLLELIGGAETVHNYLNELGVSEVIVADTEKEIGRDWETQYRNWASPDGAVALLRALWERRGLSEESRKLLLELMTVTPTGQKRLKGLLPAGTIVAHKTGTSGNLKGVNAATNDIGLITLPNGRHLAIAVFVSDSTADAAVREEVIAKIARAVWDEFAA
jgi:beta-lactamase class A